MPRISSIPTDKSIGKNDKLLGSDTAGGTFNYPIKDLSSFLRKANLIGAVGQISYVFYNELYGGNSERPNGTITIDQEPKEYLFSTITTLKVSKYGFGGESSIENILLGFINKQVAIVDVDDQNNFGIYICTAVEQDTVETDFYDLTLEFVSGEGSLVDSKYYSTVLYAGQASEAYVPDVSGSDLYLFYNY